MSENLTQTCPNCGADQVRPVRYGYPTDVTLAEAAKGDFILGGCVIDDYASPDACGECGVGIWPHRMFHEDTTFHIELVPGPDGVDARVFGQALWVQGADDSLLFVAAQDYETLLFGLLVEVVDDGEQFAGWLRYRRLPFTGEVTGPVVRFTFHDDTVEVIDASGGTLTVSGYSDRLILYLLRAFIVDRGVGLDGFTTWLADLGIIYAKVEA